MTIRHEKLYWSGRELARVQMTACILFMGISVQLLAGTAAVMAITPFCLAYLLYMSLPAVLGEKHKILMFNLFISCVSVFVLYEFLRISRPGYKTHVEVELVMIARMKEGAIPCPVMMMLLLPTMAAPVGMSARWAALSGLFCLILFGAISTNIYQAIQGDDDKGKTNMRVVSFMHDLCCYLGFIGIAFISSLRGSEVSESYIAYLHAGSLADSILNHILKVSLPSSPLLIFFKLGRMCYLSIRSIRTRLRERRAF